MGQTTTTEPAPTLADFTKRYFDKWIPSRRHKRSGIETRRRVMKLHVLPVLGETRLDEITEEMIGEIKAGMKTQKPRSVNSALSTLHSILNVAVRWRVIPALPCPIDLLKVPRKEAPFHDFEAFEKLIQAAERLDWKAHLLVLLGGRAGLRRGEIIALRWDDVNIERGTLTVRRQSYAGETSTPKGGHERTIPLAAELRRALERYRHARGELVICWDDGSPICETSLKRIAASAARNAQVPPGIHILRHTFISHLAMRGVPPRAIQGLAGHRSLATTMGYMHLSPAAAREGIAALDAGDLAETQKQQNRKPQKDNR